MWITIVFSFLAGILGGNALPHFIKGITREGYPNVLGGSPVVNLVAGWAGLVITALLAHWARMDLHPTAAFIAVAVGPWKSARTESVQEHGALTDPSPHTPAQ
jgi:hypothetical protein